MPTFAELKKETHVTEHPLFVEWDQRVEKMRAAMQQRTATDIDLVDIFSKTKQVGIKAGDRSLNAFIQEAAFAAQEVVDVLDWPLPPRLTYNNAKHVKYARHDDTQVVDAEILFNVRIATVTGVTRQALLPVAISAGEVVPPSTLIFEDRMYVIGQTTINSIVNRNTSFYLEPLRRQYAPPFRNEELDIAVEHRNTLGYQPREFSGDNLLTRSIAHREAQIEDDRGITDWVRDMGYELREGSREEYKPGIFIYDTNDRDIKVGVQEMEDHLLVDLLSYPGGRANPDSLAATTIKKARREAQEEDEIPHPEVVEAVTDVVAPAVQKFLAQFQDLVDDVPWPNYYVREFKQFGEAWVDNIARNVAWAEESGSGDVSAMDFDSPVPQLVEIIEKVSDLNRNDLVYEFEEVENGIMDEAFSAAAGASRARGGRREAQDFEEKDWDVPGSPMKENSDGLLEQDNHDPRKVDPDYKRETPGEKSKKKDKDRQQDKAEKQKNEKKREENTGRQSQRTAQGIEDQWNTAIEQFFADPFAAEAPTGTTPATHLETGEQGAAGGFASQATKMVYDQIKGDPALYARAQELASQSLNEQTFARQLEAETAIGGIYEGEPVDWGAQAAQIGDIDWNQLAATLLAEGAPVQEGAVTPDETPAVDETTTPAPVQAKKYSDEYADLEDLMRRVREGEQYKVAQVTQPGIPSALVEPVVTDPGTTGGDPTVVQRTPTETAINPYLSSGDPTGDLYRQILEQPQIMEMVNYAMQEPYQEDQVAVIYDAVLPLAQSVGADPNQIDWYGLTEDLVNYVGFGVEEVAAKRVASIIGRHLMKAQESEMKQAQNMGDEEPGKVEDIELQRFTPAAYDVVLGDMVEAEEQGFDTFPRQYAHVEKHYILKRVHTCSKDQWFNHLLNDGFIINPYGPNRGRPGNPDVQDKKVRASKEGEHPFDRTAQVEDDEPWTEETIYEDMVKMGPRSVYNQLPYLLDDYMGVNSTLVSEVLDRVMGDNDWGELFQRWADEDDPEDTTNYEEGPGYGYGYPGYRSDAAW